MNSTTSSSTQAPTGVDLSIFLQLIQEQFHTLPKYQADALVLDLFDAGRLSADQAERLLLAIESLHTAC